MSEQIPRTKMALEKARQRLAAFARRNGKPPRPPQPRKRFLVLYAIVRIFQVLGILFLAGGVFAALNLAAEAMSPGWLATAAVTQNLFGLGVGGPTFWMGAALVVFFVAILGFVFIFGAGELIYLFLALEENTRITGERLLVRPLPMPAAPTQKPLPAVAPDGAPLPIPAQLPEK